MAYLRRYPEVDVEWMLHDRRPNFIAEGIDYAIRSARWTTPAWSQCAWPKCPASYWPPALMAGRPTQHAQDLQPCPGWP